MTSQIIDMLNADWRKQYYENQLYQLEKAIKGLDPSWIHSKLIYEYLEDATDEIRSNLEREGLVPKKKPIYERRIEKYTTWIETIRLVNYQYGRFSDLNCSFSEGLYASLCDLTAKYFRIKDHAEIAVVGCGPGRTVADMAMMYPNSNIYGLDYSFLALSIAEKILISKDKTLSFPFRDIKKGDDISSVMSIQSFGFDNVKLGLFDIMEPYIEKYDLVICSNTVNLLPNHEKAVRNLVSLLREGGIIVFADLIGWRLDRPLVQRRLNTIDSIKSVFDQFGVLPIECYRGGPYIEQEGDSRVEYMENYYVGKKI